MWERWLWSYGRCMVDGDSGTRIPGVAAGLSRGLPSAVEAVPAMVLDAVAAHGARDPRRPALIDAVDGQSLCYGELASLARATAQGLAVRGLRRGDVVGVRVAGARDLALAVHAVTAAGAVPLLLPEARVERLTALLVESEARLLFTAREAAAVVLTAAEESYVRQVFAFGEVPGTTPVAELAFPDQAIPPVVDPLRDLALRTPEETFTHADRLADLFRLSGTVEITDRDIVVACDIDFTEEPATWLGLIDLTLTNGATFVAVHRKGAGPLLTTIERHDATIAVTAPHTLRELTVEHPASTVSNLRLVVTGRPAPEMITACRRHHGWTVTRAL
jgi:acyl-coenzyme A synthetase/AMP-(fatty) acid ligase